MTAWKPVAHFLLLAILLTIGTIFGINHYTGTPNAIGGGILVIIGIWAIRVFN